MPKCIYRSGISHWTFSWCSRKAQASQESCFKSTSPVWMPQTSYWLQSCRGHLYLVSCPVILISTSYHGRLYTKGGCVGSGFVINCPVPYSEIDWSYKIQSLLMLTINLQLQQLNLFFFPMFLALPIVSKFTSCSSFTYFIFHLYPCLSNVIFIHLVLASSEYKRQWDVLSVPEEPAKNFVNYTSLIT